jgi:DNA-binding CsgD family transcriptional regulator
MVFCDDHDNAMYGHCLRGNYVALLEKLGRWDEALEIAEQELSNPRLSPFNRAGPCLLAGLIHARRGDPTAAAVLLDEATRTYNDMACNEEHVLSLEKHWLDGDLAGLRQRATSLAQIPGLPVELTAELAVWLRRVGGDPSGLATGELRGRQLSEPWPQVVAMWEELGSPYEQALALHDSGEEEPMRQAIALLDRLGATAAINAVRAEMRRRGFTAIPRGSRAGTRADPWGLTPRQREVLELVADGLTNADIAGRLVLSERTVDHHVAALLDKLGATSRHDAARKARGLASAASG